MTKHSTFGVRSLRALAAVLAIVAVSLVAAAPRASADALAPACNDNGGTSNACLQLSYRDYLWWDVHVGIDVWLPPHYAQEIVDCGARFKATLRGDDGKGANNPVIRELSVEPGWPFATANSLAAALIGPNVYNTQLDEDDEGTDELYANISYYDCHTGLTRNFTTGTMRANFGW